MELTRRIASFAAEVRFEALPETVVETVKALALDTVGTTLAGTTLGEGTEGALRVARHLGDRAEATLLGTGSRAPALAAAFANGASAHALNYDALGGDGGHLGVSTLPAALAAAEQRGAVSGRELIAAMAAAAEITARLAAALAVAGVDANARFLEGQLLGYFGAAAGAGRAFGLDAAAMHDALGVALVQAGGTMQVVRDGDPPVKAIYGGFPNLGGVLAAQLARAGVGAAIDVFEGSAGLFAAYFGGAFDRSALAGDLGREWRLLDAWFKPWPVSGVVQPFAEAALDLAATRGLRAASVTRVVVRGGPGIRPWCEPLEARRHPGSATTAADSVIHAVASALARGRLGLAEIAGPARSDSTTAAIADRTICELDPAWSEAASVEIGLDDGRTLAEPVGPPLGGRDRPLGRERLTDKFRECARYAAASLAGAEIDALAHALWTLEATRDVSEFTALACGAPVPFDRS